MKLFDDSSAEEDGALLKSDIERINPEDFDRPTKSSVITLDKPAKPPPAKETPKVDVPKKAAPMKPVVSVKKQKKFINHYCDNFNNFDDL